MPHSLPPTSNKQTLINSLKAQLGYHAKDTMGGLRINTGRPDTDITKEDGNAAEANTIRKHSSYIMSTSER